MKRKVKVTPINPDEVRPLNEVELDVIRQALQQTQTEWTCETLMTRLLRVNDFVREVTK